MGAIDHAKVSSLPDGPDPEEVQPSDWNTTHTVSGGFEKVSSNDTTYGYLHGKIVAGSGISLTETNDGGDETLVVAATVSGGMANPMTTQDDLIIGGTSGAPTRLAKGSDGQVLTVDPTTHHLVWATPTGGGGSGTGLVPSVSQSGYALNLPPSYRAITDYGDGLAGLFINTTGSAGLTSDNDSDIFLEPDGDGRVVIDTGIGFVPPALSADPAFTGNEENAQIYWNTTTKQLRRFQKDSNPSSGLWFDLSSQGWATIAYPYNFVPNGTYSTAVNLAANGGSMAVPFRIPAPMAVNSIEFWGTDTSLTREWETGIYFDNGHSATANIHYDSNQFGGGGTVSSAGLRVIGAISPAILLPAGTTWVVIRNINASNTLGIGTVSAAGSFTTYYSHQTKTLGSYLGGSSLDLVTGWSKATGIPGIVLRGKVLGQSSAY